MRHLTDDEIQDYLDLNPTDNREDIKEHLDACDRCRRKLEDYQIIAGQLNADHIPALSPDFAASVMSAIEPETHVVPDREPSKSVMWLSTVAVIVLGIVSTIYFTGFSVAKKVFTLFSPANVPEPSFVYRYKEYISGLDLDFSLILAIVLVLAVIVLIDRMIKKRRKPVSFMI